MHASEQTKRPDICILFVGSSQNNNQACSKIVFEDRTSGYLHVSRVFDNTRDWGFGQRGELDLESGCSHDPQSA